MWLVFALISPLLFAVMHVLDSFCVEEIYERPWMGGVVGALASSLAFIPFPFIWLHMDWAMPSYSVILMGLTAGLLIQTSQFCYFHALSRSEAGIVAAYWNMIPGMVPVASFLFLGRVLTINQYLGITILAVSSAFVSLLDTTHKSKQSSFWLMVLACAMQAAMFLLEEQVYNQVPFLLGFYIVTLGLVLTGLIPFAIRSMRTEIRRVSGVLKSGAKIFILIEVINLLALACSQKAVSLGIPSLVAAVESTIPAYTFILSGIFLVLYPRLGEKSALQKIPQKLVLVCTMILGVWLVS